MSVLLGCRVVRIVNTKVVQFSLALLFDFPLEGILCCIVGDTFFLAIGGINGGENSASSPLTLGRGGPSRGVRGVCGTESIFLSSVLALSVLFSEGGARADLLFLKRRFHISMDATGNPISSFVLALETRLSRSTALSSSGHVNLLE